MVQKSCPSTPLRLLKFSHKLTTVFRSPDHLRYTWKQSCKGKRCLLLIGLHTDILMNSWSNFFKVSTIVFEEFSKALHQMFKHIWVLKFRPVWEGLFWQREAKQKFPQTGAMRSGIAPRCFRPLSTLNQFAFPDSKGNPKPLDESYVRHGGFMPYHRKFAHFCQ